MTFAPGDEQASERKASFKSNDGREARIMPELVKDNKETSSVAGDINSERGFVMDSLIGRAAQEIDLTPTTR